MAEIILTKENFNDIVLNSDIPVVVDFWASWCGPCVMMAPVISKLAEEADGRYLVGKVNVSDENELSEYYKIFSIPSILIFKNGEVTETIIGYSPKDKILKKIGIN